jgi:CheY-like chemotaxis protein
LIALTGYGQPADREVGRQAGFDAHLVKPVRAEELLELLDNLRAEPPTRRPRATGDHQEQPALPSDSAA